MSEMSSMKARLGSPESHKRSNMAIVTTKPSADLI
jgi:hypothetical protein